MREFIKSMFGFSWAMSLFGAQQMAGVVNQSKAAKSFDNVRGAAEGELNDLTQKAFTAGDRLQRGFVDMVFGVLPTDQPDLSDRSATPQGGRVDKEAPKRSSASAPTLVRVNSGRLNRTSIVMLGEGLAAGMGNFSLMDETQEAAFPAQLARQMQAEFPQALFQPPGIGYMPGFAKSLVAIPGFQQTTVLDQMPSGPVSNLSVPGLKLSDALTMRPCQPLIHRSDEKQTAINLILGLASLTRGDASPPPTQLECALKRQPTLAIVELGYCDVLEAAIKNDPTLLPSLESFRSDYDRLLKSLKDSGSEVVVMTVPDPMDTAHFSGIDTAAKIVKVEPGFILNTYKLKADDLISVTALNEIGYQLFGKSIRSLREGVIMNAETARQITNRVSEINEAIAMLSQKHGAVLHDLHGFCRKVKQDGVLVGSSRLTAEFLGGFYLLNGYYPGATGHALIANDLIHLLNKTYGADFPETDAETVIATDPVAGYRQAPGPNWSSDQLPKASPPDAPQDSDYGMSKPAVEKRRSKWKGPVGWDELEPEQPTARAPLRLPPGLKQVLPLSKAASYYGDGISPMQCRDEIGIQWGSCNNQIFGGLAMVDSHLSGSIEIKFSPAENNVTRFEVSFLDGFPGDDAILATPQFFKMPFQQSRVDGVPGTVSSGALNLETGLVTDLTVYARYSATALGALVSVNPTFPKQPLSFPGQYGSAWAEFEQRPDGLFDFSFYGSTFVPLGKDIRWPLNFVGPSQQFATIPAPGTVMHPHLALSTKEPAAPTGQENLPDFPFNSVQELTLFTHNSSFGDRFGLDIQEWGGEATGRSQVLGRVQIQFGERSGNTVPMAVRHLQPGGLLESFAPTPVTQLFPAPLPPGPMGFNELLRFPLRTYSLNDLAILDDPFDISVGAVNLATGNLLYPMLHRAFINQDLIFALIRVAPDSAKTFFLFRGPSRLERGIDGQPIYRFKGSIRIPFPQGMQFPKPDLATGYVNLGKEAFLDPFLWIHAIHDDKSAQGVKQGGASDVLASTGDRFSYRYAISTDPVQCKAFFEYVNHSQNGSYRMHSLSWVAFSSSGSSRVESGEYDTVSFTAFGTWSKDGVNSPQQAAVQISTSTEKPYVGIQIGGGFVSNVNTKPPNPKDALP